ncbi:hypothetical protein ACGLHS_05060 [Variovorax sp. VaC1]|uniref:hypothetical protein n=1 Tax=Variovorax sp. VaC1 TaxID=3373132 RepID=UPI003748AF49
MAPWSASWTSDVTILTMGTEDANWSRVLGRGPDNIDGIELRPVHLLLEPVMKDRWYEDEA